MEKAFTCPTLPEHLELLPLDELENLELPLLQPYVSAGFPSPADDYLEDMVNLYQILIKNPSATFLVRVRGDSMQDARLYDGDILVLDRSLKATEGRIIIGKVNGEFMVKRLVRLNNKLYLQPANEKYALLEITEEMDFQPWGVVVWALHKIKGKI